MGAHEGKMGNGAHLLQGLHGWGLIWHHHINQLYKRVLPDGEDSHSSTTIPEPEISLPEDNNSGPQSQEDNQPNASNTPIEELPTATPTRPTFSTNNILETCTHSAETSRMTEQAEGPHHSLFCVQRLCVQGTHVFRREERCIHYWFLD